MSRLAVIGTAAGLSRSAAQRVAMIFLVMLVLVGAGAVRAQAATAPVPVPVQSINAGQTLAQIIEGLGKISPGQPIEVLDPKSRELNTRTLCSVTVTVTLYVLGAATVAYLASTGAVLVLGTLALPAAQLAALAGTFVSWPSVYAMVDSSVCAQAVKPTPTPTATATATPTPTGSPTAPSSPLPSPSATTTASAPATAGATATASAPVTDPATSTASPSGVPVPSATEPTALVSPSPVG